MGIARSREEMFSAILDCETEKDAQKLVRQEVASMLIDHGSLLEDQARKMVLDNIGYLAAYFDRGQAAHILQIFGVEHPKFGPIENWPEDVDQLWNVAKMKAQQDFDAMRAAH